jgi:hypothetical protein
MLAKADVRVDGANAQIGRPGGTMLPMRWTGDGWKVDMIELARQRGAGRELLARACQHASDIDQLVKDIEAGKYESVAQALDSKNNEATASIQE